MSGATRYLPHPDLFKKSIFSLKVGECYDLPKLRKDLIRAGYSSVNKVDASLQFASRGDILDKLVRIKYLNQNKKTQIITPENLGEMIYEVVTGSIPPLLRADLTASWEKGLTQVAEGSISADAYMEKLEDYVTRMTVKVKTLNNVSRLNGAFAEVPKYSQK